MSRNHRTSRTGRPRNGGNAGTDATSSANGETRSPRHRRLFLGIMVLVALVAGLFMISEFALWRAQLAIESRRHEQAIQWLRPSSWIRPFHAETHYLLARAYRRIERYDQVESHLRQALDHGWNVRDLAHEQQLVLAQTGRFSELSESWGTLFQNSGSDAPEICQAYVTYCLARLEVKTARQIISAWQHDYPDDPDSYVYAGKIDEVYQNWSSAAAAYRRALELDSTQAEVRRRLSFCLLKLGQIAEAKEQLTLLEATAGYDGESTLLMAQCQMRSNEPMAAEATLRGILTRQPQNFEARILLAELLLDQDDPRSALEQLELVMKLTPENHQVRYLYAKCLQRTGRTEEALPHLKFVEEATAARMRLGTLMDQIVADPDDVEVRFDVAMTHYRFISRKEGVVWLKRLLELAPTHRPTHRVMADYYMSIGNHEAAAEHERMATEHTGRGDTR